MRNILAKTPPDTGHQRCFAPPRFRVLRAFLGGPVFATSLALLLTIAPALAGDVYDAVLLGDVAAVRELIARKADLDEPGDLGTPLHAAATKGNSEIAGLLIDNGADVEATDEFIWQAAASRGGGPGPAEVAELLIAPGADLEAPDIKGGVSSDPRGHRWPCCRRRAASRRRRGRERYRAI